MNPLRRLWRSLRHECGPRCCHAGAHFPDFAPLPPDTPPVPMMIPPPEDDSWLVMVILEDERK